MGCDGGTIPRRDEMVKLKKKAEKAEKDVELVAKWRHCALSAEKLQQPIVSCDLGRLYNKETVLMTLLDKSNMPEIAKHIRSLKDVVELQLTPNPGYKPNDKADTYNDVQSAEHICPVTGLEMSGHHRFNFIRTCGCVLSEKALKEVPSENCHTCGKPFVKEDVIIINGTEEDIERQREAMEEKRKAVRLTKRKRKSDTINSEGSSGSSSESMETSSSPEQTTIIAVATTSTVVTSSKLKPPQEKLLKVAPPVKPKSTKKSSTRSKLRHSTGHESRKAYQSLFTSSAPSRPKEQSAHWVTYFPYH